MTYAELIAKLEPYKNEEIMFDGYRDFEGTEIRFRVGENKSIILSRYWNGNIQINERL